MTTLPILQADDDQNDILLLQYAVRAAGISNPLHSVTDGQEAVDYLSGTGAFADRKTFPLPCLVLTDIKMPRLNGLELLRWIRAQPALRSMVVIIFTSTASQQEIDRAYELGANSFITKPAGADKLIAFVKALQTYWIGHNNFSSACMSGLGAAATRPPV